MKTKVIIAAVLFSLVAWPLFAKQPDFQGTIRFWSLRAPVSTIAKIIGDEGDTVPAARLLAVPVDQLAKAGREKGVIVVEVVAQIKGPRVRLTTLGAEGGAYVIQNTETDEMWQVTENDKSYVATSRTEYAEMMNKLARQTDQASPPRVAESSLRELAGKRRHRTWEVKVFEVAHGESNSWVSSVPEHKHASLFRHLEEHCTPVQAAFGVDPEVRRAALSTGLPVAIQTVADGQYKVFEVLEIREEKIPEEKFTIPKGYTQMTLQDYFRKVLGPVVYKALNPAY